MSGKAQQVLPGLKTCGQTLWCADSTRWVRAQKMCCRLCPQNLGEVQKSRSGASLHSTSPRVMMADHIPHRRRFPRLCSARKDAFTHLTANSPWASDWGVVESVAKTPSPEQNCLIPSSV